MGGGSRSSQSSASPAAAGTRAPLAAPASNAWNNRAGAGGQPAAPW